MEIKTIIDEDFSNYKKPSMLIAFPHCSWKCDRDCGQRVCHNGALADSPSIEIPVYNLCSRYLSNPLTSAIVCAGLEPFDSIDDLFNLLYILRHFFSCEDDVVIYTGYTQKECEAADWWFRLSLIPNITVKFGRFIPNQKPHFDEILGVELASDNQYAIRLS